MGNRDVKDTGYRHVYLVSGKRHVYPVSGTIWCILR